MARRHPRSGEAGREDLLADTDPVGPSAEGAYLAADERDHPAQGDREPREGESARAYRRRIRMADPDYRHATRLRRTLLLVSAVPVLILLALGVKLISLSVVNAWGASAYDAGRYATATKRFAWNGPINVFDPYVQLFNEGTAAMQNAHFADAETLLRQALTVVPDKHVCDVRSNLALTIMYQGDVQHSMENWEEANRLYVKAMDAWMVEPCWTPPEEDEQEQQPQGGLEDQLQERKDQNDQDRQDQEGQGGQNDSGEGSQGGQESTDPNSPSQGGTGPSQGGTPSDGGTSPGQGGTTPSSPGSGGSADPRDGKQQDLQDRNDKAQQDRDAERQRGGGGDATKGW